MGSRFYYSVCQFGAEKTVKEEVVSAHPGLNFAFSRPGFITFKEANDAEPPIENPESIFTRLWGLSMGQGKDAASISALSALIPEGAIIHAFERDTAIPGDEPEGWVRGAKIGAVLRASPFPSVNPERSPKAGEWVYDLIWIDENHVFLGKHQHYDSIDPAPGNQPWINLPANSPSRAYLKLEEAIHRFKPKVIPGLQVLEVGCSPGGATLALLTRKLKVTGIDPKFMDRSIVGRDGFHFIQKTAKSVVKEDLLHVNPEWLVLDMNLAPLEALDEIQHVLTLLRAIHGKNLRLKEGFLTLKLNDWKFASHIPLYLRRVGELGFRELRPTQLCSNRQEFFVQASGFR